MYNYNENTGLIIALDLDNFKECVRITGWTKYSPNDITKTLTIMVDSFLHDFNGICLWGLDFKRGTEEAIVLCHHTLEAVENRLEEMRKEIERLAAKHNLPTGLSIGVAQGVPLEYKPLENRKKQTKYRDPLRMQALKALKKAKKRGGNQVIVY